MHGVAGVVRALRGAPTSVTRQPTPATSAEGLCTFEEPHQEERRELREGPVRCELSAIWVRTWVAPAEALATAGTTSSANFVTIAAEPSDHSVA